MNITALSLFSGIGGGDLSLEMAGVDVLGMCEKDPFCQEILKKNFHPRSEIFFNFLNIFHSKPLWLSFFTGGVS